MWYFVTIFERKVEKSPIFENKFKKVSIFLIFVTKTFFLSFP